MPATRSLVDRAHDLNLAARFIPGDPDGFAIPMLRVAGVDVNVYVDSAGALRVSIHTDTGEEMPTEWAEGDAEYVVPMRITVNGETVAEF